MAIKLTKNEMRSQQKLLSQLQKYLPTLQLKKAMLQSEVQKARQEIAEIEDRLQTKRLEIERSSALLSEAGTVDIQQMVRVDAVERRYENFAGVEVPIFSSVAFSPLTYPLFETSPWIDPLVLHLREIAEEREKVQIAEERKTLLEKELREVSIRVNLFEKVLIPRAHKNIKKIRVFLGDQELAAVARGKVAKGKIESLRVSS